MSTLASGPSPIARTEEMEREEAALAMASAAKARAYTRDGKYIRFAFPALLVIGAVIIFPWLFTIYMSLHDWQVGQSSAFVGLSNYVHLAGEERFYLAMGRTLAYTALATLLPVVLGVIAALVFHREFPLRNFMRGVFILPMMATPVAIALVWTMMFHPQLGVLNYLMSLIGIPPQLWVFSADTVIPSLVLVEVWQWTPLVMLIVLGGLSALPTEPYESAEIDGATSWQMFRHITWPMVLPFVVVATIIRAIDAIKAFDTIFVITQGGPGTSSETINIYLYLQAFAFYKIGYSSAVVVVFFTLIVMMALVLLWVRQRVKWTG